MFTPALKHHRSLWLDFFVSDIFSPSQEDASFVKQKAALESELTTKLLVAVRFAAENSKSFPLKTESIETHTD